MSRTQFIFYQKHSMIEKERSSLVWATFHFVLLRLDSSKALRRKVNIAEKSRLSFPRPGLTIPPVSLWLTLSLVVSIEQAGSFRDCAHCLETPRISSSDNLVGPSIHQWILTAPPPHCLCCQCSTLGNSITTQSARV